MGLITLALQGISSAAKPLAASEVVQSILHSGAGDPILMVIVIAALTVLVHSSVAVVLLIGTLAAVDALTLQQAIVLVVGANLGGALLPVLATWLQPAAARGPAVANALVRTIGVVVVLPFTAYATSVFTASGIDAKLAVAHFHTTFNLLLAIAALPFIHQISAFVMKFFQNDAVATSTLSRSTLDKDASESRSSRARMRDA